MEHNIEFNKLNNILKTLKDGDTVLIEDGTYTNQTLILDIKGKLNNRITIKAKNPGKVILTGRINLKFTGEYITFANFILRDGGVQNGIEIKGNGNRITGCDISFNTSNGPIISIYSKNNRCDHCIFSNFSKFGVWLEVKRNSLVDYILIDHNIFKNRSEGTGNGFECIRIGTSGNSLSNSRTIIENNLFENVNGETETISVKSCENIIYKNILKDTKGTITLRHGNRSIVSKNKFYQNNINGSGGIRVIGEDHIIFSNLIKEVNGGNTTGSGISIGNGIVNSPLSGYWQVKNTKIIKNILLNNHTDFTIGLSKGGGNLLPINCEFKDNIVYKTNSRPIFSSKGNGCIDCIFTNNKYYGNNLGSVPKDSEKLLNTKDFDPKTINENNYGTTDILGPRWNIKPEILEIDIDIENYYNNLKTIITNEINESVTIPEPVKPIPEPVKPNPESGNIIISSITTESWRGGYSGILSIQNKGTITYTEWSIECSLSQDSNISWSDNLKISEIKNGKCIISPQSYCPPIKANSILKINFGGKGIIPTIFTFIQSINQPIESPIIQPINPVIKNKKLFGYFSEWSIYGRGFSVDKIPGHNLTHIMYAFMLPNPSQSDLNIFKNNNSFPPLPYYPPPKIPEGVITTHDEYAHQINMKNLKILKQKYPHLKFIVSIGGWTLSWTFSKIVKDPILRQNLIKSCVDFCLKNNFDGVDIDWEYVGKQGIGYNYVDTTNDTPNFIKFLKELRDEMNSKSPTKYLEITAATGCDPVVINNYKGTEPYLDYILLMTYDFAGSWDNYAGNFSGLYFDNNSKMNPNFNVHSSVENAKNIGFNASKICVGIPMYGRGWNTMTIEDINKGMYGPSSGAAKTLSGSGGEPGLSSWKDMRDEFKKPEWITNINNISKSAWDFNS